MFPSKLKSIFFSFFAFFGVVAFADTAPNDMQLFLLIGQSNMAGRGKVEAIDQETDPKIFMLDKAGQWVPAKEPLHFDKPGMAGVGPGYAFARAVLKANPNAKIGIIPCAVGGTTLDQWKAGDKLYSAAVARTKEAMKSGKLAGILWHQGESDADKPEGVPSYPERFSQMIAQLRKDLQAEQVPVIFGELIKGFKKNDDVNAIFPEAKQKVPNSALVSSEGLGKKALHFDSADARKFGERYAEEFQKLKNSTPLKK